MKRKDREEGEERRGTYSMGSGGIDAPCLTVVVNKVFYVFA